GNAQGAEVVVKVLRPGVQAQVARDMAVLARLARLAERFVPRARRFRVVEVVSEYDRVINDELDLLREGGNASQLGRNWAGSDLIYHPRIYFDYSCESVLVMERIRGIPIDDTAALQAAGVDFQVLAGRGVATFCKQVFCEQF